MPITYVNSWTDNVADSGSLEVSISGTTAGNLLIGFCAKDDGSNGISQPSGWTEVNDDAGSQQRAYSCWKIAEGNESSVLFDGDTESYAAMVFEFSGVDTTAFDFNSWVEEFTWPLVAPDPAYTPSADNALIIQAVMHSTGVGYTITYDSDLTYPNSVENSGPGTDSGQVGIQVGYAIQTTAAAAEYSHGGQISADLLTFGWLESTGSGSGFQPQFIRKNSALIGAGIS